MRSSSRTWLICAAILATGAPAARAAPVHRQNEAGRILSQERAIDRLYAKGSKHDAPGHTRHLPTLGDDVEIGLSKDAHADHPQSQPNSLIANSDQIHHGPSPEKPNDVIDLLIQNPTVRPALRSNHEEIFEEAVDDGERAEQIQQSESISNRASEASNESKQDDEAGVKSSKAEPEKWTADEEEISINDLEPLHEPEHIVEEGDESAMSAASEPAFELEEEAIKEDESADQSVRIPSPDDDDVAAPEALPVPKRAPDEVSDEAASPKRKLDVVPDPHGAGVIEDGLARVDVGAGVHAEEPHFEALKQDSDGRLKSDSMASLSNIYFVAVVAGCSVAGIALLAMAGVCGVRMRKRMQAASEVEYPAYGVTGPTKEKVSSPVDRKLAQSAQMYHYQHQKQQMIASERMTSDANNKMSDAESDEENEEGHYTVFECPGLATAGEMEVRNPLFSDETPVATPMGGTQKK